MHLGVRGLAAPGVVCLLLGGCFSGTGGTDPVPSDAQEPADPPRTAEGQLPSGNSAPAITGNPQTSVGAGGSYSYEPAAQDMDGDTLSFSITGKPAWASFSVATGALTGTPAESDIGSYGNIVISASDGQSTSTLQAFQIEVIGLEPLLGTASLSWQPPTHNTDASQVTGLAGYRVYRGFSPDALTEMHQITTPDVTSYVFDSLVPGTHYFAVSTYTIEGVESELSAIMSKTIPQGG